MSDEERTGWGAGWAGAQHKLRSMLVAELERTRAQERTEERLGGEHLPCLRSRAALLQDIAAHMGIVPLEERAP